MTLVKFVHSAIVHLQRIRLNSRLRQAFGAGRRSFVPLKTLRILIRVAGLRQRDGNRQTSEGDCDHDTQFEWINLQHGSLTVGQRMKMRPPLVACVYGAAIGRSFDEGIGSRYDEISGLDWVVPNWNVRTWAVFFLLRR